MSFVNNWGSLHTTWSSFSSHFENESSNLQSSTVLKMQSSSSTTVAIDNLHSSASQIFGPSHLHSSMKVGTNLHLPLHANTTILKSSRKPAGSPIIILIHVLINIYRWIEFTEIGCTCLIFQKNGHIVVF